MLEYEVCYPCQTGLYYRFFSNPDNKLSDNRNHTEFEHTRQRDVFSVGSDWWDGSTSFIRCCALLNACHYSTSTLIATIAHFCASSITVSPYRWSLLLWARQQTYVLPAVIVCMACLRRKERMRTTLTRLNHPTMIRKMMPEIDELLHSK